MNGQIDERGHGREEGTEAQRKRGKKERRGGKNYS